MSSARLRALVEQFAGRTVAVVGDLILDEYVFGRPARISREAPVLILRFTDRALSMGGAANAAHNVHTLGARVIPIGVIGRDAAGNELTQLFKVAGVSTDGWTELGEFPIAGFSKTQRVFGLRDEASAGAAS